MSLASMVLSGGLKTPQVQIVDVGASLRVDVVTFLNKAHLPEMFYFTQE